MYLSAQKSYLLRRWNRVLRNILRCFFLRMRLRRFLMRDPMAGETLTVESPTDQGDSLRSMAD
jgi:hypothetical protein